jgi:predicted acetyltransferase
LTRCEENEPAVTIEAFQFVDPGPLQDLELELVAPHERWIDLVLRAAGDPLTRKLAPADAQVTRHQLVGMLESWPGGHQMGEPGRGVVPAYHFWMKVARPGGHRTLFGHADNVAIAGGIGLRIGHGEDLEYYYGHIGYHVYPPSRGRHYAERACRLLLPLAAYHGVNPVWITTNPDNLASRRTCERLGGQLVDVVDVPPGHPLYLRGERRKCRYRVDV